MSKHNNDLVGLDLASARARLSKLEGEEYWRSLEELADTAEFRQFLNAEFPSSKEVADDPKGRRNFLKLMGASMALAGFGACVRQPEEKIVPYVKQPEDLIPGKPRFYATAINHVGASLGVLVESHMWRPTKIEGNPRHPASLGATDSMVQASVLDLYDPDRTRNVRRFGRSSSWRDFENATKPVLEALKARQGAGLRVLSSSINSPSLKSLLDDFLTEFPEARWHQWEAANRDNVVLGAELAFGEVVDTHYRFDKAEVVVSLDSDFLLNQPGSVRYARDYARRRKLRAEGKAGNRLYVVESQHSITGGMADHRLAMAATDVDGFCRALAVAVGVSNIPGASVLQGPQAAFFNAMLQDLKAAAGKSVVLVGREQPAHVHALVHAINDALGNVGRTVVHTDTVAVRPESNNASLKSLTEDMAAGKVDMLVFLDVNPVLDAPADLEFANALEKVETRVHFGMYENETARLCHWHLPANHTLESWGDGRAYEGTLSIVQPLIAPLYQSRSSHEVVAFLAGKSGKNHDLVKGYWQAQWGELDFDRRWRRALHDGVVDGSAFAAKQVSVQRGFVKGMPQAKAGLEVVFRPDPHVWDGRFANNGWLQELPKPVTKLTWDNALHMAPATATRLGLKQEDVAELRIGERTIAGPVLVVPGWAPDSITVHYGYGRRRAGRIGNRKGFDAYPLRTSDALSIVQGASVEKTGRTLTLATTQKAHSMQGRGLVRAASVVDFAKNPKFVEKYEHGPQGISLYPEHKYDGDYSWGMTIDLNACTGCNACAIACQAENNISVVGKEEVSHGREMHWIRVDTYYKGDPEAPQMVQQPVPCMHCENAPCEPVCPVNATVHGPEGLNQMVYNRCVGTRYCSNNCPYKVRRFNFYLFADYDTESFKAQRNPDVSVRSRGVMEKCTYCVQRISEARIQAKKEGRKIRDGEVVTACQSACPTEAIAFGNLNDPKSKVNAMKASPLNYGILNDLNTRPRTTYLARLNNPNDTLSTTAKASDSKDAGEHL